MGELAAGLTAAELRDWLAYDRIAQTPAQTEFETMRQAFAPRRVTRG